ncbi:helix-turn-helix domain-containing protein [Sphaerisporangium sp. NPDC005288]|uniref:helix-turn-helix domain-containing protein n=1 Tax=Sphaerisporangium sp. NPDC005288 TaxID=3155114 RepID=UPI0033AA5E77
MLEQRKSYRRLSEVAREVGVAPWTLRRLARSGDIRAWHAGPESHWLVDPESVTEYLRTRRTKTSDSTQPLRSGSSQDRG